MTVQNIDLYYRPWWAFEFHWKPKDKNGHRRARCRHRARCGQGQALAARVTKMMNRDALFDIGADTVGLLVPGGSIAVKVAKLAIDQSHKSDPDVTRPAGELGQRLEPAALAVKDPLYGWMTRSRPAAESQPGCEPAER